MFNVGGGELLVIALIALIVLGPQRLPDAARTVGRVMGELRRMSSGFQQELKDAFDPNVDPEPSTPRRKESAPLASTVAETERSAARRSAADRAAASDTAEKADSAGPTDKADSAGPTDKAGSAGATDDADATPGPGPADTVAPAVADALDEIVAPTSPSPASAPDSAPSPSGPLTSTPASSPPSATDTAGGMPTTDPADGEGLGDQRAAS